MGVMELRISCRITRSSLCHASSSLRSISLLMALHFVDAVGSGSEIPVMVMQGEVEWGEREGEHNRLARILWTDADFISTFEIDLLEGTYYEEGRDSLNDGYVVVNRSLVDLMGWKETVGRTFYLWGHDRTILGVTEDIKFFPFTMEVFSNYRYEALENTGGIMLVFRLFTFLTILIALPPAYPSNLNDTLTFVR